MENRVGQHIPTEAEVKKLLDDLERILERLGRFTVLLTNEERRRALKFRSGGEAIVERIGALVDRHGIVLPGVSHAGMDADLRLARALAPLEPAAARISRLVADTILVAGSECWSAATAYYTTLARVARQDPQLQADLRDIITFFARGRRAAPPPDGK